MLAEIASTNREIAGLSFYPRETTTRERILSLYAGRHYRSSFERSEASEAIKDTLRTNESDYRVRKNNLTELNISEY